MAMRPKHEKVIRAADLLLQVFDATVDSLDKQDSEDFLRLVYNGMVRRTNKLLREKRALKRPSLLTP